MRHGKNIGRTLMVNGEIIEAFLYIRIRMVCKHRCSDSKSMVTADGVHVLPPGHPAGDPAAGVRADLVTVGAFSSIL
jgi:hypothetical protein